MNTIPIRGLAAAAVLLSGLGLAGCERPGEVQPPAGSTAPAPVPSPVPATPTDTTPSTPMPPASAASQ